MIFLSKYQANQLAEPVKIKTSPFRNLDRTCNLIEEVFREEKSSRKKTYICKPVVKEWGVLKNIFLYQQFFKIKPIYKECR